MPITRRQLLAVGLAAVGLAAVPRLGESSPDVGITGQEIREAMVYADRVQPERAFLEQYKHFLESDYATLQLLAQSDIHTSRVDAITALSVDPYDRIIHAPNPDEIWLRFNAEDVDSDA